MTKLPFHLNKKGIGYYFGLPSLNHVLLHYNKPSHSVSRLLLSHSSCNPVFQQLYNTESG